MCIFMACSPDSSAPQIPNLVITTSPAAASVSVSGGTNVTTLSGGLATQSGDASSSFHVAPGAYYTVTVDADEHSTFSRRIFVRDDRRINVNVGLARRGGKKAEGGYTEAFEAENASVRGNLEVRTDDTFASGGAYLMQPAGGSSSNADTEDAVVSLEVPANATYTLWARMYADYVERDAEGEAVLDDGMFLGFNGQLARISPEMKELYTWVRVGTTRLNAGRHRISIGHATGEVRLDLLVVTSENLNAADLNAFVTQVAITETVITPAPPVAGTPAPTPTPTAPTQDRRTYALRGDPSFSLSQLTAEQRKWYDTLWTVITNPEQHPNAMWLANSDNIHHYRGDLQNYVVSVLIAFRMTGDLRLLDEVSKLAEAMRSKLADGWRGTVDGTDGTRDGFLNWVNRYDTSAQFAGKDTQRAFDLKAHALVAMIAWALENNRDLASPGGVNYGAQADFWKGYLVNHFFPVAEVGGGGFHSEHSWMRWHHYMGKLTGNSAYTREAVRMADLLWNQGFRETSSAFGSALLWPQSLRTTTSFPNTSTYARYVVLEAIDLHFEEFHKYADAGTLRKMASAVSAFVLDDDGFSSFARDIGGGLQHVGLTLSDARAWPRMDPGRFAISGWSLLSAWDTSPTARLQSASMSVYRQVERNGDKPTRIFIPTAMFVSEFLR
jgi:hypothetical protein